MKKSLYAIAILFLLSSTMTACTYQPEYSGSQKNDSHGAHRH